MARLTPFCLRVADHHGANLCGPPHQQGVPQLLHERVKPQGIVGGFEVHRHRSGQPAVEPFHGVRLVGELLLAEDAGVRIKAVQIATDQGHEVSLPSRGAAALGLPELSNRARPFS